MLDEKGLVYKGAHEGWYSVSDECFYTDSQVLKLKTLPTAHNEEGEVIVVSKETGSTVEWMQEENYKFRLSTFRDSLLARYEEDPSSVYPPEQHSNVLAMLSEPLNDLSISRP